MWASRNFIFLYSLGKHTLVKGVSLLFIFLGMMKLCDNNEGLHFFSVSLARHTFFKGVLKMKRFLAITLSIIIVFSLCACGNKETAKINCSSCGESISKDVAFCEHCGVAVNNEKTESENTSSDNSSSAESKTEETSKPSSTTENTSKPITSSKPSTTENTSKPSTQTHTHSYINETITKQPTCTEQGIKTFYCSSCSGTKAEYIEATGHKWEEATCVSPKKCSICNITDGEKLEHSYSGNNCTFCGTEKIVFNYSWENYPVRITGYMGTISVEELKCYVENNAIYVECYYVSDGAYAAEFDIKILSSNKGTVTSRTIVVAPYPDNQTFKVKECLVSRESFMKLESGEYYVIISE